MTVESLPGELLHAKLWFSTADYVIFFTMMAMSALIGIYYGFFAKQKQDNTAEYLLGSKQMKVFPVAMSLTATHISAITMLGVPAEMYRYGIQYWVCSISGLVVTIFIVYIFLPVFYELQTSSCYAYLEQRFSKRVRSLASFLFMFYCLLNVPVIIYTPAIAFSQVSGINVHIITPVICCICIFYTTVGGIRAVIWTDTLQFGAMLLALAVVMILGTLQLGGIVNIYKIADAGGRLIWFNMDPDPTLRSSFWLVSIGLTSMWISNIGVTPECVQRFLTVPDLSSAKKAVWIFGVGHIVVKLCSVYNGLLVFSKYHDCDPVYSGLVKKNDQIFPYYVLDVAQNIPGLPGLFVVGIFSAALSTMSTTLNTLSGTIYDDFVKTQFSFKEKTASNIIKLMVVLIGVLCLVLVFVVEKLGSVFSLAISVSGVTSGTLLGIFSLGMFSPKINDKGAFWGSLISLGTLCVIAAGAQLEILNGHLKYPSLPLRYDGCPSFNSTGTATTSYYIDSYGHDNSEVPWIFRLGFMYYSILGTLIAVFSGTIISYMTGGQKEPISEKLLTPWVRPLYKPVRSVDDYEHVLKKSQISDAKEVEMTYK
ncbi:sodium-coupled monocarboxylate transporter 1-like [Toxorhynchites rutilus septentrionalis]|uniref:sodium-coupled monocarboxylate transporter 1-like n=1 Tax=Toxorhynchites rutilus septentrionalis TaxID=329112 RepID=UPI0024797A22|nr:sodium-coupled monocarboxylate transporter 1-like [Toxorhynchites rutilus septentrionalis]